MLQYLKDLSIRLKISGFVIPSTVAFGVMMTILALYFLNDYKETSLNDFRVVIEKLQAPDGESSRKDSEKIIQEMSLQASQKIQKIGILFVSIVAAVILMATIGALVISGLIGKPLKGVADGLENISSGDADLTQRLPASSNDETGRVSRFFNIFLEKLQVIIKNLQGTGDRLNNAAGSIYSLIEVIQGKNSSAKELAQTVYRSAGYMSGDMKEISTILQESTGNIHTISVAVQELTETVTEISETSGRAHINTENTKKRMQILEKDVQELGRAAEDISKVTETIAEISDQVNLLALNATIEAARAGEAGKGFAVVANEIKELAHQTANAATEIQDRIEQVQKVSNETIAGIVEATENVSENTEVVSTIASAVEEQSATVSEIGGSLSAASEKLDYSNNKVSKASEYADDMARMADKVSEAINEVDDAVDEIANTSESLRELANESARTTRQFHT